MSFNSSELIQEVATSTYPHGFLYVVLSDNLCRAVHVPLETADQLSETQQTPNTCDPWDNDCGDGGSICDMSSQLKLILWTCWHTAVYFHIQLLEWVLEESTGLSVSKTLTCRPVHRQSVSGCTCPSPAWSGSIYCPWADLWWTPEREMQNVINMWDACESQNWRWEDSKLSVRHVHSVNSLTSDWNTSGPYLSVLSSKMENKVSKMSWRNCRTVRETDK